MWPDCRLCSIDNSQLIRNDRAPDPILEPFFFPPMTTEQLCSDYQALRMTLQAVSPGDEAALRSLERKYEQLREARWFGDISYAAARDELFQECYDCFPVDE